MSLAPFWLKNTLRALNSFYDTRVSRSANLGDYDYLVTTEASMMAIMLLSDADYEVLLDLPPSVLEFDCIGSMLVGSGGEGGGPQDDLDGSRTGVALGAVAPITVIEVEGGEIKSSVTGMPLVQVVDMALSLTGLHRV